MKTLQTIKIVIPVLFLALLVTSCSSFLDEAPKSDFTQKGTGSEDLQSKYATLDDAQAELQGAYETFKQDIGQFENFRIGDVQSDNCFIGGDGVPDSQLDLLNMTATNSIDKLDWGEYYAMAGDATTVIENLRLMDSTKVDLSTRNTMIAEAKFIRAWAYFDIVRIWGAAPMVLSLIPTITSENLDHYYPVMYPARASEDSIYKQIIKDLDENTTIKYLPSLSHGAFRATKGAAYGLLAKVWATMPSPDQRDYSKVIACCDKVTDEGYHLVDDYESLWKADNKFTAESIFEVEYTETNSNWSYWVLLKEGDGSVTWRRYCTPTQDLVAKFDKAKDKRYVSSIIWRAVPYNTYWSAGNYPLAYKIREKTSDIILLRYADVLLMKAEAYAELGKTQEAIDIVNMIRRRAGVKELSGAYSAHDALVKVEDERQLELFMEGQRWFDLIRTGLWREVMGKTHDEKGNIMFPDLQDFRQKWPIPQSERDKNVNLTQNEGY